MRSFLGVNGFVDDPIERLVCVGAVREYQDWVRTQPLHDICSTSTTNMEGKLTGWMLHAGMDRR